MGSCWLSCRPPEAQVVTSLYPIDRTMAPVKRPMNPDIIIPPMAPRNITSIGTGAPFPISSGLSMLSRRLNRSTSTDHSIAGRGSLAEKRYIITGIATMPTGN